LYPTGRNADCRSSSGTAGPQEFGGTTVTTQLIHSFVAEEANPKNTLGINRIEVSHPGLALQDTLLIDTPGIGSTHAHNTATTLSFLPECDAALFVLSADPPITEAELEFLDRVRRQVQRLVFVLNKIDVLEGDDGARLQVFLDGVLRERAGLSEQPVIFPISARDALAARRSGDAERLQQSGLVQLEAWLRDTLQQEKHAVLQAAVARRAAGMLLDEEAALALRLQVLRLPIEESERRLAALTKPFPRSSSNAKSPAICWLAICDG